MNEYIDFEHVPILLEECIDKLNIKTDGIYIDGTVGGAGHSREIYKRLGKNGMLIGFDQDEYALSVSYKRLTSLNGQAGIKLVNMNFENIREFCIKEGIKGIDGCLLDLGASSFQLDEGKRGFSYQKNATLDMRMDIRKKLDARQIVNQYTKEEIKKIIKDYGEEKWADRIAEFICNYRKEKEIETTYQLVDIIKAAIPSSARREGPHPAKRTFQALRIAVNDELGVLERVIDNVIAMLSPGGRFCIITFHSLEDRIVKSKFLQKQNPCMCPTGFPVCVCGKKQEAMIITKKPIVASSKEVKMNPRSRSAKLRVLEKV